MTAYINGQSTASEPFLHDLSPRAGAPAYVTTRADGQGGWLVSWAPCTGPDCFTAAASWNLIGSSCGTGFVGQPPDLTVPASTTSVTVNAGNDLKMLGDQLTFSVQGLSSTGLRGAATSDHTCTQAWQPPGPGGHPAAGGCHPCWADGHRQPAGSHQWRSGLAYGGDRVTFTYRRRSHGGADVSSTVTIPGLVAAKSYVPTVVVTPVGHPAAALPSPGDRFPKPSPGLPGCTPQRTGRLAPTRTRAACWSPSRFAGGTVQGVGIGHLWVRGPASKRPGGQRTGQHGHRPGPDGRPLFRLSHPAGHLGARPLRRPIADLVSAFTIGAHCLIRSRSSRTVRAPLLDPGYYVNYHGTGEPAGTDWRVSAMGGEGPVARSACP